ncbi:MAG: hypothetical protein IJ667_12925 [Synergistaceae bacterium]|nr:hypothetical protein [Synergistaceae bacterium]
MAAVAKRVAVTLVPSPYTPVVSYLSSVLDNRAVNALFNEESLSAYAKSRSSTLPAVSTTPSACASFNAFALRVSLPEL